MNWEMMEFTTITVCHFRRWRSCCNIQAFL